MGARLVQTRGGCMLIIRRPKKRKFRHKAKHESKNALPCKHWHGEAAQRYHDQLMKDHQLNAGLKPQESLHGIPTASQENATAASAVLKDRSLAWFDGACEPVNPGGTATFGVVIKDADGIVLLKEHGLVGRGSQMSNNVAEYAGALHILKYLASCLPGRITIHGDSKLVINQLNGNWRIKKGLYRSFALQAKELLDNLRCCGWQINFCWIPREQNEECDALSKKPCQETSRSTPKKAHNQTDPRDAKMIGRRIKTTGITVLRAGPSSGPDWWLCRCSCGREFVAHGWGVRHGRTRNCGSEGHEVA